MIVVASDNGEPAININDDDNVWSVFCVVVVCAASTVVCVVSVVDSVVVCVVSAVLDEK